MQTCSSANAGSTGTESSGTTETTGSDSTATVGSGSKTSSGAGGSTGAKSSGTALPVNGSSGAEKVVVMDVTMVLVGLVGAFVL